MFAYLATSFAGCMDLRCRGSKQFKLLCGIKHFHHRSSTSRTRRTTPHKSVNNRTKTRSQAEEGRQVDKYEVWDLQQDTLLSSQQPTTTEDDDVGSVSYFWWRSVAQNETFPFYGHELNRQWLFWVISDLLKSIYGGRKNVEIDRVGLVLFVFLRFIN